MRTPTFAVGLIVAFVLQCSPGFAQSGVVAVHPFISPLFTDNMVLQRDRKDAIWGWTAPGVKVTVALAGKTTSTISDLDGKWTALLPAMPPGGPYTIDVSGPQTVRINNVLFGDVWICSGQSNMEFGIGNGLNAKDEIAFADHPFIRLYMVPHSAVTQARDNIDTTSWSVCSPATVSAGGWNGFSAVAYFFGRELQQHLSVPIGLIQTCWGGTPAEAWTSADALRILPDYATVDQTLTQALASEQSDPKFAIQNVPSTLYNGMISPLIPFGITGVIWYQGESNAGRAAQYRWLLPTMIKDWRARWGEGDFPFMIAQISSYGKEAAQPTDDPWAELREAQAITAQTLPNTGLAVTIDVGDPNDIHPKNKQDVGRRLALAALAKGYHQQLPYSGPEFLSQTIEDRHIRLKFLHSEGGLIAKDGRLQGFEIAGADRHFVWADAALDGDTITVYSADIPSPAYVRYAWGASPGCNLYNQAGLPAVPFRTDPVK